MRCYDRTSRTCTIGYAACLNSVSTCHNTLTCFYLLSISSQTGCPNAVILVHEPSVRFVSRQHRKAWGCLHYPTIVQRTRENPLRLARHHNKATKVCVCVVHLSMIAVLMNEFVTRMNCCQYIIC